MQLNKEEVINIETSERSCECCNGKTIKPAYSSSAKMVGAKKIWKFPVNIAICKTCGFCFSSPAPNKKILKKYYADGLVGYKNISLPYSIDIRVNTIKKYKAKKGIFVEIGGDNPEEFHRKCSKLFSKCIVVDISDDAKAEIKNINSLPSNFADVIAHYDVLEHVLEVKTFLLNCHRVLKDKGFMICEVPDLKKYPGSLLLQEFEHVNHFSAHSLSSIAEQVGLSLVDINHNCSRPFGITAIFKKIKKVSKVHQNGKYEYVDALACIKGGIIQIENNKKLIKKVRKNIANLAIRNKKIILWGVTDLLRSLIDEIKLSENIIIVDSDPRRKNHLKLEGILVKEPKDCILEISELSLLVICAPRYSKEIISWIEDRTEKPLDNKSISIIGASISGETLR
jgi:hypothetical protein